MANKSQLLIKVFISLLLFLCLLKMPYGYFQFVRFAAFVGFAILAFQSNEQGNKIEAFIYGVLALLFQPFFKVSLGRQLWNIVDVIVGIGLIITLVKSDIKPSSKNRNFHGSQKAIDKSKTIKELTKSTRKE
jgi:hypothetical protein